MYYNAKAFHTTHENLVQSTNTFDYIVWFLKSFIELKQKMWRFSETEVVLLCFMIVHLYFIQIFFKIKQTNKKMNYKMHYS